ncbi:MAG TPA: spermidine/putrescine ABC transporter substrate-binding protein [Candidatus Binatia bacterium]|nr:spermidine/putrescine ABC transporter substrate-binding protein [Candidatus Binatia bacterium]
MTGKRSTGLTFDEALTRHLRKAGWSRREFLARVAAFGAATALTQLLIACNAPAATPSPAPATPAPTPAGTTAAEATPAATPEPTPVPEPEGELYVYNWADYIGEETVAKFEEKYGIKVTYDNFADEATQIGKIQSDGKGGGYDVTYPASTWMPEFIETGVVRKLDHSLIPNLGNLAAAWQNPGYDPGNQYSVPNMWWTTGYAWNGEKIDADLKDWAELWKPEHDNQIFMLDDIRECFAAAAFVLGLSPNTTDLGELDQILAKLEEQKPLVRDYTTDHIAGMIGEDVAIAHCWSGDWVQMTYEMNDVRYVIPSEGAIKGNDVMVILSGAPHPIAAHLWIDFNLDAQISAENTNYIGYMGPNEAAWPMIEDYIIDDPRLNPPPEELAMLVELQYLEPVDLAEYTSRWNQLRA